MIRKLNLAFPFKSVFLPSFSENCRSSLSKTHISWISAYSTFAQNKAFCPEPNMQNPVLADYLMGSLKFSKDKALTVSSRYSHDKYLEKPEQVVHFFRGLGFSDTHIQSIARSVPQLLFADIEKTLKPKIIFFQELGLSGSDLSYFIFKNPYLLRRSLDVSLKPTICVIKKVIASDGRNRSVEMVNDELFRIIRRCNRIFLAKQTLETNILYLKRCGVVGSQLSSLLFRQPRIFILNKDKLADLVSRALDMNFTMGSGMLVHGIRILSCVSMEKLNGKFDVLKEFGFSMEEVGLMFRKCPHIFGLSGASLRCKLELLLSNLKINGAEVVKFPNILSMNIEERVIPRYRVLEMIKSRGLMKKDPSLSWAMCLPEGRFLQSYVEPFKTDAEELMLAYSSNMSVLPKVETES